MFNIYGEQVMSHRSQFIKYQLWGSPTKTEKMERELNVIQSICSIIYKCIYVELF